MKATMRLVETTLLNLEYIMISEISQTQKDTMSFTWESLKVQLWKQRVEWGLPGIERG